MQPTVRQLVSLEHALGAGCEIEHKGKKWVLRPLKLSDMAKVVRSRKADGVAVLFDSPSFRKMPISQQAICLSNVVLQGAREEFFQPNDPNTFIAMLEASLRHEHPNVTRAQIEELLDDNEFREKFTMIFPVITTGEPLKEDEPGAATGADPLERPLTSTI